MIRERNVGFLGMKLEVKLGIESELGFIKSSKTPNVLQQRQTPQNQFQEERNDGIRPCFLEGRMHCCRILKAM